MAERTDWRGDQADGLRRLFGCREPQVIAFASGREACGRTTLVVQTAVALAAAGQAVVVIDENSAPDNVLTAFGLGTRNDLFQVVRGDRTLAQVAQTAAPLVRVVPAARAARELDHMGSPSRQRLAASFKAMQEGASFILIDCASNRRNGNLSPIAELARHFVVVVAAQSAAITHSYALIKRLHQDYGRDQFQIAVARARSPEEARAIFDNMRRVAREHLSIQLEYLGASAVPVIDHLADALIRNLPPTYDAMEAISFGTVPPASLLQPELLDSVI